MKIGNLEWHPVAKCGNEVVVRTECGQEGVVDLTDGTFVVIEMLPTSELEAMRQKFAGESIESIKLSTTAS